VFRFAVFVAPALGRAALTAALALLSSSPLSSWALSPAVSAADGARR
jgi:hypothetical protein